VHRFRVRDAYTDAAMSRERLLAPAALHRLAFRGEEAPTPSGLFSSPWLSRHWRLVSAPEIMVAMGILSGSTMTGAWSGMLVTLLLFGL
jgi:hypothetical protein